MIGIKQRRNVLMKRIVIIFIGISFVTYYLFRDSIILRYTMFADMVLFGIFNLVFLIATVYQCAMIFLTKRNRTEIILLIYLICCFIIVTFFPYDMILKYINFRTHIEARDEVIQMLYDGDLMQDSSGKAVIPKEKKYDGVSAYNEVYIYHCDGNELIYFPIDPGFLDYSCGFAYINGNERQRTIDSTVENIKLLYDYGGGWYYIQIND